MKNISQKGQKVTFQKIAEQCGVSIATISRVVNDNGYVRAQVREKILTCLEDWGYRPSGLKNRIQASQRQRIAIVARTSSGLFSSAEEQPGGLLHLANKVYEHNGEMPMTFLGHRAASLRACQSLGVDLVTVYGMSSRLLPQVRALAQSGTRVIVSGYGKNEPFTAIMGDCFDVGQRAAQALKAMGHKRIGVLVGIGDKPHPKNLESVSPYRVQKLLEGILSVYPDFDLRKDAVSDCFGDWTDAQEMLQDGTRTAWIVNEIGMFRCYLGICSQLGLSPRKDRPCVAILENPSDAIPPQAVKIFYRDLAAESELFLKEMFSPSESPQEWLVPFIEV